jgi:hypothetical protein
MMTQYEVQNYAGTVVAKFGDIEAAKEFAQKASTQKMNNPEHLVSSGGVEHCAFKRGMEIRK